MVAEGLRSTLENPVHVSNVANKATGQGALLRGIRVTRNLYNPRECPTSVSS